MNTADARKRVERLTRLIEGFRKAAEDVLADRGVLTSQGWSHYATAIYEVLDAFRDAWAALQMAARR
jgi:hypothetical protein